MNMTSLRQSLTALATKVRKVLSELNAARIAAEERYIAESDAREVAEYADHRRKSQQIRNYFATADARYLADADARERREILAEEEKAQQFRDIFTALR